MAQTKINKTVGRIFTGLHGQVYKLTGGRAGKDVIVLTTTGRKSGQQRERPIMAGPHDDGFVVVASFSGHDEHPAWYLNLKAEPKATVLQGRTSHQVVARETEGEERQELWERMVQQYPDFAEYQAVTDREIPVLVLEKQ